jgi:hypothetical protein
MKIFFIAHIVVRDVRYLMESGSWPLNLLSESFLSTK